MRRLSLVLLAVACGEDERSHAPIDEGAPAIEDGSTSDAEPSEAQRVDDEPATPFDEQAPAPTGPSGGMAAEEMWPAFEDLGLLATHIPLLAHNGIGQACADYDADGDIDLFVTGAMVANTLLRNEGDGTFTTPTLTPEVEMTGLGTGGASWADVDQDGWLDLFVVTAHYDRLFRSEAGVSFTDITAASGLGQVDDWSVMAAWGDLDGDADLDLYVANHGLDEDRLYLNLGDATFIDISASLPQRHKPAFAATFTDFDEDGDADIYVVNDHMRHNDLLENVGPGCGGWCLVPKGGHTGADTATNGMGLAVGDYDNDLDLDFFFSDIWHSHLLRNDSEAGPSRYSLASQTAGVDFFAVSWGTVFFDFDNDGWRDLYLATQHPDVERANRVWHNLGDGTFADVSEQSGAMDLDWSYGVAACDFDEDGFVDLVIGDRGDGYRYYHNLGTVGTGNHWLQIDLFGSGPVNLQALGARAYVIDTHGIVRMDEVRSGSNMGGDGTGMRLHFGLAAADVERVRVIWPNGQIDEYDDVPTDAIWSATYQTR